MDTRRRAQAAASDGVPDSVPPRAEFRSPRGTDVALTLAISGVHVFPLWPVVRRGGRVLCDCWRFPAIAAGCPGPGKHPRIAWKAGATSDFDRVLAWALRWPSTGMGAATGRRSGVFILDVDGEEGRRSWAALEEELGSPAPAGTWRSSTGRSEGGEHWWFALPPDAPEPINNASGVLAPKVDIRGRGGFAVCPGSLHKSGTRYAWLPGCAPDDVELAQLAPAWAERLPYETKSGTPGASRPRRVGARGVPTHDSIAHLPMGDGPGHGGFHDAIFNRALRYFFGIGADAPAEPLIAFLRADIEAAPKGEGRSVARYFPPSVQLEEQIERARAFVSQAGEIA